MAEQGGPSSIGAISVDVTADISKLQAQLKEAEAATTAAASKMGQVADSAGTGAKQYKLFSDEEKKVTQTTTAVGSAIGGTVGMMLRFSGVVALVTTAVALLSKVVGTLERGLDNLVNNGEKHRKYFRELSTEIEKSFRAPPLTAFEGEMRQLEDKYDETLKKIRETTKKYKLSGQESQALFTQAYDSNAAEKQRLIEKDSEDTAVKAFEGRRRMEQAEYDKRVERLERQRAMKRIDQRADVEAANRAAESEAARFDRVDALRSRAQSASSPLAQLGFQKDALAKEIADAFSQARSPIEQQMIIAFGGAIAKGLKQQEEELKQTFKNAFLDMLNEAMQDSQGAFGIRDMTVQLSQISRQIQAIQQTMPR